MSRRQLETEYITGVTRSAKVCLTRSEEGVTPTNSETLFKDSAQLLTDYVLLRQSTRVGSVQTARKTVRVTVSMQSQESSSAALSSC